MSDGNKSNLTNPDLWIRLIYMIIFGLLSALARIVVCLVAAVQFFLVLLTGEDNKNLRSLGDGIAQWTQQTYLFLSFASEHKPYPFQDWPQPIGERDKPGESAAESAQVVDKTADTTSTEKPSSDIPASDNSEIDETVATEDVIILDDASEDSSKPAPDSNRENSDEESSSDNEKNRDS